MKHSSISKQGKAIRAQADSVASRRSSIAKQKAERREKEKQERAEKNEKKRKKKAGEAYEKQK